jgi:hypothetical protein
MFWRNKYFRACFSRAFSGENARAAARKTKTFYEFLGAFIFPPETPHFLS